MVYAVFSPFRLQRITLAALNDNTVTPDTNTTRFPVTVVSVTPRQRANEPKRLFRSNVNTGCDRKLAVAFYTPLQHAILGLYHRVKDTLHSRPCKKNRIAKQAGVPCHPSVKEKEQKCMESKMKASVTIIWTAH